MIVVEAVAVAVTTGENTILFDAPTTTVLPHNWFTLSTHEEASDARVLQYIFERTEFPTWSNNAKRKKCP